MREASRFGPRPARPAGRGGRRGFTLVEVNLALLVIGVGLLALFGLFPVGLRQANLAAADSVQAIFADQVFNQLHANAATITNFNVWMDREPILGKGADKDAWVKAMLAGTDVDGKGTAIKAGTTEEIANYQGKGRFVTYRLVLHNGFDSGQSVNSPVDHEGRLKRAYIRVSDRSRKETNITNAIVYCTDFVFMGEVPR
jgi:prepilin-type N-terminal cleavage/methylation domain-containing protein